MKVFIVGIRGFLGSRLARALTACGHSVRGSASAPGRGFPAIRLGDSVDPSIFEDADIVVHAAHDFSPGSIEINVRGAALIFEAARSRRRIFLSSCSARPDAASDYGIAKYRAERLFIDEGETVVRPGLVIGAGGLFGRQLRFLLRSPVIPLLNGGRDPVPILAIADYTTAMTNLIESGRAAVFNLFNEELPTMRTLVETVLRLAGRHAGIVTIPAGLAERALATAALLRLPLPVSPGSVRALRLNRECVHTSDLRTLIQRESSLDEMLRAAITALRAEP